MTQVFAHPQVTSSIQDRSQRATPVAPGGPSIFIPIFAEKGPDREVRTLYGQSDLPYVETYGNPIPYKYGQANFNLLEWLVSGGQVHAQRLLPEDASLAHAIIDVQTSSSPAKYNKFVYGDRYDVKKKINSAAGNYSYVVVDDNGVEWEIFSASELAATITSDEEKFHAFTGGSKFGDTWPANVSSTLKNTIRVYTETKTVVRPMVRHMKNNAVNAALIEARINQIDGNVNSVDGFKSNPIGYFYSEGRGSYYNNLRFEFKPTNQFDNTFSFRVYQLTVYDLYKGDLRVLDGPFNVSFDKLAVDRNFESMFIDDVLVRYAVNSDIRFKLIDEKYEALATAMNPDVPPRLLDVLFVKPYLGTVSSGFDSASIHKNHVAYGDKSVLSKEVNNRVKLVTDTMTIIEDKDYRTYNINYTSQAMTVKLPNPALFKSFVLKFTKYGSPGDIGAGKILINTYNNETLLGGGAGVAYDFGDSSDNSVSVISNGTNWIAPTGTTTGVYVDEPSRISSSANVVLSGTTYVATINPNTGNTFSTANVTNDVGINLTTGRIDLTTTSITDTIPTGVEVSSKVTQEVVAKATDSFWNAGNSAIVTIDEESPTTDTVMGTKLPIDVRSSTGLVIFSTGPAKMTITDKLGVVITHDIEILEVRDSSSATLGDRWIRYRVLSTGTPTIKDNYTDPTEDIAYETPYTAIKVTQNLTYATDGSAMLVGPAEFDGGSDGSLFNSNGSLNTTVADALLITAFNGTYNPQILDYDLYDVDHILDAGYSNNVKNAMKTFASDLRPDTSALIDLRFSNERQCLELRNALGYNNRKISFWSQCMDVFDVYSGRNIKVTATAKLARKIPAHNLTFRNWVPFAGARRGGIDGFIEGSLNFNPTAVYEDQFYKNQINYIKSTSRGTMIHGQLTSQRITSALSDFNHVAELLVIQRDITRMAQDFKFDVYNAENLRLLNQAANEYIAPRIGVSLKFASISFTSTEYDEKNKTVRVAISVEFFGVIEKIDITFFVR